MISKHKLFPFYKIINNYHDKEELCLERAKQHDYFPKYRLTNKGAKQ
tara:strand:- start:26 stop:166 length:141 start_codon:yes stop_codon:yes gene_type:complete